MTSAKRARRARTTAGHQGDEGDEESRARDRPDDGEGGIAELDGEDLGQVEQPRHPGAHQRADEADADGREQAAARVAGNGLADRATDTSNDEQENELEGAHGHGISSFFLNPVTGAATFVVCRALRPWS
jgi:hypothetical protein